MTDEFLETVPALVQHLSLSKSRCCLCSCPTCEHASPSLPTDDRSDRCQADADSPIGLYPGNTAAQVCGPPGGPHHGTTRQCEISGAASSDRETKGTSGTSKHIYNESQHQRRQRQAAVLETCSKSDRCFLHRASL